MKLPLPTAALWDMDGTLIDQTGPIVRCYREVITEMGYPEPSPDAIRRSMGGPMTETIRLFVEETRMDEACKAFRARFPEIMFDGLIVLPGAHELIAFFASRGLPQAILTNKHGDTARLVSAHCGFDQHIPVCIGNTDTEWAKPQPELTRHVLAQIGANETGAILIGDSPTDAQTALNADIDCHGVATGAHSVEELTAAGALTASASLLELRQRFEPQP